MDGALESLHTLAQFSSALSAHAESIRQRFSQTGAGQRPRPLIVGVFAFPFLKAQPEFLCANRFHLQPRTVKTDGNFPVSQGFIFSVDW